MTIKRDKKMEDKRIVCFRCGEFIGSMDDLDVCPVCGGPLRIEELDCE